MAQRDILERLARGEIDKAEAERLLDAEQAPPPVPQETPPPKPAKSNLGCCLGVAIAAVIGLLVLVALFFLFTAVRVSHSMGPHTRIMRIQPQPAQPLQPDHSH